MIPEKHFYTIGDVCRITGTKPHVLRYWESRFKLLRPARRYSGHRKYSQQDIDMINRVRFLVVDRRYTLAGAKKELYRQLNVPPGRGGTTASITKAEAPRTFLREIKREVEECAALLTPPPVQQEFAGFNDL